ncbi:unnamed protein product [Rhizoctonia solani]|uniref:F-box domain-containing protein n=1 Tax=Rhizoctonia solani TaxID=456999 RepID=A0A8H3E0X2_9AGAM|nr:unnamed protein product [Rhizoctonia solani]
MSSLANSLAQLHDLRVLGLGPMVLDLKMMTILSSLPHLESLIFYDTYHSRKLEELLKSVNGPLLGSFSTLQHFGIKSSFNPERAARVWNITLLPLQYLWLFGKDYPYVGSRWDGERFALAFPKMEHLRICGYYFTFEDLKFIAMHMPRLGQLSARVQLNAGWPSKDELSSLVFIPSPSQLYFRLQLASSHTIQGVETVMDTGDRLLDEIERLALALHALWPKGVICEPQRRLDEDGKPSYTSQINTALRALYEVSGDNAMGVNPRPRKHVPRWFGWI